MTPRNLTHRPSDHFEVLMIFSGRAEHCASAGLLVCTRFNTLRLTWWMRMNSPLWGSPVYNHAVINDLFSPLISALFAVTAPFAVRAGTYSIPPITHALLPRPECMRLSRLQCLTPTININ